MDSLTLQSFQCSNFRNLSQLEIDSLSSCVIFVGPNAVGKSNLVEGIQLLSSQQSFRSAKTQDLIQLGSEQARISGLFTSNSRRLDLSFDIKKGSKTLKVNGKKKAVKEKRSFIPSVVFSPDDLFLIKGSESLRRKAFDGVGIQLSSSYKQIQHDFEKILKQKNQLLKQEFKPSYLESINEVFNLVAAQFIMKRKQLAERFLPYLQETYASISNLKEVVNLEYLVCSPDGSHNLLFSNWGMDEIIVYLEQCAYNHIQKECQYGRCLYGPQLDKFLFSLDMLPAQNFASQGQQRSIALAFKLAEHQLIQDLRDENALLILDDVMSELDSIRRERLLDFLSSDIQSFITTTHLDYFTQEILDSAQLVNVQALVSRETLEV